MSCCCNNSYSGLPCCCPTGISTTTTTTCPYGICCELDCAGAEFCPEIYSADCAIYNGSEKITDCFTVQPGMTFTEIIEMIAETICPSTTTTTTAAPTTTTTSTTAAPTTTTTTEASLPTETIALQTDGEICNSNKFWISETPAQVKCDWLEVFDGTPDYGGSSFKYYTSAGINIGTQLYFPSTGNPPATSLTGNFIYLPVGASYLDAQVITIASGVITAITDLSDLPACPSPYPCP